MRVGLYVDGFNLYYGARGLCGRGTAGWRWFDLRGLGESLVARASIWPGARIERIVYCTARIDGAENLSGQEEQEVYLQAIRAAGSVDLIEFGYYVSRVKRGRLAVPDSKGRPIVQSSAWPVMVEDRGGSPVPEAKFMVSYAHREEKGSDVNVATHLMLDVLGGEVDAAIVIPRQRPSVSSSASQASGARRHRESFEWKERPGTASGVIGGANSPRRISAATNYRTRAAASGSLIHGDLVPMLDNDRLGPYIPSHEPPGPSWAGFFRFQGEERRLASAWER